MNSLFFSGHSKFLVRVFPQWRGGWVGFTIMPIYSLTKPALNDVYFPTVIISGDISILMRIYDIIVILMMVKIKSDLASACMDQTPD